ncbi:MAG: biliverdin-producing heme oxygenase, partial [Phycisphaerales bacterium]|nr:biliverdin-producing heme oxygenase [Phycisphaerales bacterium]
LRLHRIDQDLQDLDCTEVAEPLAATSEFVEFVSKASVDCPISMIGVLYVKEGATNGNKFIAKKLRETMGLDEGKAMGYLDPHGKDQRRCWNAFKEQLNELKLTEQEEDKCLEVAQETFKMVMNISRQIPVAHEPATVQA